MSAAPESAPVGLAFEFEYHAQLKEPVTIGTGPNGTRIFFETSGGDVVGDRISGRVMSGGGDWFLMGSDGWARLDARAQIETTDGAVLYAQYGGPVEMNDAVARGAESGEGTQFEDQYMRAAVTMETGDPRYAWVNHTIFIYQGRFAGAAGVHARIYRVT